jgi:hypothetical protein
MKSIRLPTKIVAAKVLQLNQVAARGSGDGFGAADDVHVGEDRFYVRFHSFSLIKRAEPISFAGKGVASKIRTSNSEILREQNKVLPILMS